MSLKNLQIRWNFKREHDDPNGYRKTVLQYFCESEGWCDVPTYNEKDGIYNAENKNKGN